MSASPHPFRVDRLAALDEGERLQPVTNDRGQLEIHILGRGLHLAAELGLDLSRFAGEESLGVGDQLAIGLLRDAADARRRAALDLVKQAGPVARLEEAVRAAPQQEQLLQRVERVVDAAGAGEGAVIIALRAARAAMLLNAREIMIGAQQDEGEAFVVAQQHVVGRAVALDQLRFEQQRLRLVVGGDDRHRAGLRNHALEPFGQPIDLGIVVDAVLQRAGLADIEHVAARILHAVDAGTRREGLQHVADRRHPRLDIGHVGAADGEGGLFLVEAIGGVGGRHRPSS